MATVIPFPAARARKPDHLAYGVRLVSRRNLGAEIEHMRAILSEIDEPGVRESIEAMECDSDACAFYTVWLRPGAEAHVAIIGAWLETASLAAGTGHNGFTLITADGGTTMLGPDWSA